MRIIFDGSFEHARQLMGVQSGDLFGPKSDFDIFVEVVSQVLPEANFVELSGDAIRPVGMFLVSLDNGSGFYPTAHIYSGDDKIEKIIIIVSKLPSSLRFRDVLNALVSEEQGASCSRPPTLEERRSCHLNGPSMVWEFPASVCFKSQSDFQLNSLRFSNREGERGVNVEYSTQKGFNGVVVSSSVRIGENTDRGDGYKFSQILAKKCPHFRILYGSGGNWPKIVCRGWEWNMADPYFLEN